MSSNEHRIHRFLLNPFREGLHRLYVVESVFAWFQTLFPIKSNQIFKLFAQKSGWKNSGNHRGMYGGN